jgi:hypothetical protein
VLTKLKGCRKVTLSPTAKDVKIVAVPILLAVGTKAVMAISLETNVAKAAK